jgi:hypothetical protein
MTPRLFGWHRETACEWRLVNFLADSQCRIPNGKFGISFQRLLAMVDPLPPCFAKKRLDVIENKGLAQKNADKIACIVLKTLRWSLQRRSKERANCSEDIAVEPGGTRTMVAGGGQDVPGTGFWEE